MAMIKDSAEYHRLELAIAKDPGDPRRAMPNIDQRHRRILDVGCGAGQTLAACNLSTSVFAVGVDVDSSALSLGRQMCATIRFVNAQGESLPFRNSSFDLIICRVALPYMHVARAVSEMSRVLSVGGDIWLVLHPFNMTVKELRTNIGRFQVKAALYRSWVLVNGLALHALGRQWSWPAKQPRYESWQTAGGVKRALLAAGFDQISTTRGNHFVVTATKSKA
jgi:ubiquinone/menaquinone biosynthesis C-methylase UbiE